MKHATTAVTILLVVATAAAFNNPCAPGTPVGAMPFCDMRLPIKQRVADLVGRLTQQQKICMCFAWFVYVFVLTRLAVDMFGNNAAGAPNLNISGYQWWNEVPVFFRFVVVSQLFACVCVGAAWRCAQPRREVQPRHTRRHQLSANHRYALAVCMCECMYAWMCLLCCLHVWCRSCRHRRFLQHVARSAHGRRHRHRSARLQQRRQRVLDLLDGQLTVCVAGVS